MKIIDLLNKIADGEEIPQTIKYINKIFDYDDIDYFNCNIGYLFERCSIVSIINDEVEVIEENKIPEKLYYCNENTFMFKCKENSYLTREEMRLLDSNFKELGNKINSIIDYIKSKGD